MLKVIETQNVKKFVNFPFKLYKGCPHYITDLKSNIIKLLTKDPFWQNNERALFLLYEDNELIGRICALTNIAHNKHWQDKTGFFGFFDCINDTSAAIHLFNAASNWLYKKGCTTIQGPVNPSTNHTCGVLLDNFDKDPFIMMPYNFSYYNELIGTCGFEKAKDLIAFERTDKEEYSLRMQKLIERFKKNKDIHFRPIKLKEFDKEVNTICKIYNESWARNWGFVPISDAEIKQTAKELKTILKTEMTTICEVKDEVAAFAICVPNFNKVLKEWQQNTGISKIFKAIKAYFNMDDCRMLMLGVHPNHRGRGLELLVVNEIIENCVKKGWHKAELSWLLEDNKGIISVVQETGCYKTKTYRIYKKNI
ncbi:MAG: hypothetical protein J5594_04465 [Elusimicrobiaceae bacterium]|nr:hypothetical protein [Elusimicrobiaceae bacterium]